jgi:erythronate-4-phosphate dehydrogenase
MKIICATNMPFVLEAFSTLGEARILEGRDISATDVRDAGILALRSTTQVNRALLAGSQVRFVGTATIGTDHLDLAYFQEAGIHWCFAPGCNANSVSEYITAALLTLGERHGITLEGKTIGVIGVGNVGSRVVKKARALGMRVLMNDPPRERAESGVRNTESGVRNTESGVRNTESGVQDNEVSHFVGLDRILAESDIITVHVPLTKDGPDKTFHLADADFFSRARKGLIFLNAARGAVVDTPALLKALDLGQVGHVVLDTWEGEPKYRADMLARVDLGTPHIAGHSFEGKVMGTVMVYREACRFLGVSVTWSHEPLMPPTLVPRVELDVAGRSDEAVLREVVRKLYDIEADDRRFRDSVVADDALRAKAFDRLRKDYPERREFQYTTVRLKSASPGLRAKFDGLGFL